jgi:hypothetical protein
VEAEPKRITQRVDQDGGNYEESRGDIKDWLNAASKGMPTVANIRRSKRDGAGWWHKRKRKRVMNRAGLIQQASPIQ